MWVLGLRVGTRRVRRRGGHEHERSTSGCGCELETAAAGPALSPAPPSSALSSIVTWGFRMRDETRAPVHIYSTYRSSTTLVPLIELFNLSVV